MLKKNTFPVKDYKDKFVFKLNNKDFRAAGFCLYSGNDENIKIMMIESERGWEFPGGKVDKDDTSLYYTAIRETAEETNGCLGLKIQDEILQTEEYENREILKKHLSKGQSNLDQILYYSSGKVNWIPEYKFKYGLFFSSVPESWILDEKQYLNMELWEKIPRKIKWLSITEVIKILKDESVKKFMMLKLNTYLKKNLLEWLENNCLHCKAFKKWELAHMCE